MSNPPLSSSPPSPPTGATFVLHFWLERSISGVRWRGSIEQIPGGARSEFLRVEDLLKFFQAFEIRLEESDCSAEKPDSKDRN